MGKAEALPYEYCAAEMPEGLSYGDIAIGYFEKSLGCVWL